MLLNEDAIESTGDIGENAMEAGFAGMKAGDTIGIPRFSRLLSKPRLPTGVGSLSNSIGASSSDASVIVTGCFGNLKQK